MTLDGKWWRGKDSNLRRQSRQIYSLIPLATREPLHWPFANPLFIRANRFLFRRRQKAMPILLIDLPLGKCFLQFFLNFFNFFLKTP